MNEMIDVELNNYGIITSFEDGICPVTNKPYSDKRTRQSHPYSYDESLVYEAPKFKFLGYGKHQNISGLYSDRLYQWDPLKHDKFCRQVFGNEGQYWGDRSPKLVEEFLCLYLGKAVKLKYIIEGCNQGNGFPYWVFGYTKQEE